jgi:hypothetical protein
MSLKVILPCALGLALLGITALQAQDTQTPSADDPTHVPPPVSDQVPGHPFPDHPPAGLSKWITYEHCDCCGPIGWNGPVRADLYIRNGPSVPVEGPLLGHVLRTGWDVAGGGRSLFFNADCTAAWTADLGISNFNYGTEHPEQHEFPLHVLVPNVVGTPTLVDITTSLRTLNITYANLWLGREWWPWGANCCGSCGDNGCEKFGHQWRFGCDLGGGWGACSAEFGPVHQVGNPAVGGIRHRPGTAEYMGAALHADLELPRGCCTYLIGFRTECNYNWLDRVLQENNSQFLQVNFLLNVGVRF